jgi:hypothetical protein
LIRLAAFASETAPGDDQLLNFISMKMDETLMLILEEKSPSVMLFQQN